MYNEILFVNKYIGNFYETENLTRSFKNKTVFNAFVYTMQSAQNCIKQQSPQRNDVFCDGLLRVLNPRLHISLIFRFDLVQEHLKSIQKP